MVGLWVGEQHGSAETSCYDAALGQPARHIRPGRDSRQVHQGAMSYCISWDCTWPCTAARPSAVLTTMAQQSAVGSYHGTHQREAGAVQYQLLCYNTGGLTRLPGLPVHSPGQTTRMDHSQLCLCGLRINTY